MADVTSLLSNMTITRNDMNTEFYHSDPVGGISFGVWAPIGGNNLPIVIFQSGYGGGINGHRFFCENLAEKGFLVIAADNPMDRFCGVCGIVGFLSLCSCSALAVDGSQTGKALAYVKDRSNRWMDRVDVNKIAFTGFSMGGQEVIHAQARYPDEAKAMVIVSGSMQIPLANAIGWNCMCAPCAGGTCPCCSSTKVGLCGQGAAMRGWDVPSMLITSDNDLVKAGMYRAKSILGDKTTLVTFKDEALDLGTPTTYQTTAWGPFLCIGCCPLSPFYGLRRHFALGNEEKDVSAEPAAQFLSQVFKGGPPVQATNKMHPLDTKPAGTCCVPFPIFWSCCEM